ncbi:MAG: K(+)-transporting ATPase subunit C [Enhydrobacter sp.]|nr:K(+)-transporting ATPase subunit C [Enhydrobacter sp.]
MREFRPALVMMVLLTVLTGLAYPLAMTGIAQAIFPRQANGSLIEKDGRIVGSELIGQDFTKPGYFHGRPSATSGPDPTDPAKSVAAPYNAANSGGSNAGPTAKSLIERVEAEMKALKEENPNAPVPVDLVTTSASGLDPDISPAAAMFQVPRVARERGLPEARVRELVSQHTHGRYLGVIGEPTVRVLQLNMALDALPKQ